MESEHDEFTDKLNLGDSKVQENISIINSNYVEVQCKRLQHNFKNCKKKIVRKFVPGTSFVDPNFFKAMLMHNY